MNSRMITHPGFTPGFFFGNTPHSLLDMPTFSDALGELLDLSTPAASTVTNYRERAMLMDVKETDKFVEVSADIPGIPKEDINVEINKNVLTLTVNHEEKKEESHTEGGDKQTKEGSKDETTPATKWHRTERSRLFVKRSVCLPESADTSAADASYTDGVLTINFPKKAPVDTSKKLAIK